MNIGRYKNCRLIESVVEYNLVKNNIINYLIDKKYDTNIEVNNISIYTYISPKKEEYDIYYCLVRYNTLLKNNSQYLTEYDMFIKKSLIDNYLKIKRKKKLDSIK